MDDILVLQFLRKKGIINDRDIHEFHELAQMSGKTSESTPSDSKEEKAKELVSKMYHTESGKKYIGEKFDMYKAKDIYNRYRGIISPDITPCDIYIAINSQYHNYSALFKSWFMENVDHKIIESAMIFWFMDEDCFENKIHKYFE